MQSTADAAGRWMAGLPGVGGWALAAWVLAASGCVEPGPQKDDPNRQVAEQIGWLPFGPFEGSNYPAGSLIAMNPRASPPGMTAVKSKEGLSASGLAIQATTKPRGDTLAFEAGSALKLAAEARYPIQGVPAQGAVQWQRVRAVNWTISESEVESVDAADADLRAWARGLQAERTRDYDDLFPAGEPTRLFITQVLHVIKGKAVVSFDQNQDVSVSAGFVQLVGGSAQAVWKDSRTLELQVNQRTPMFYKAVEVPTPLVDEPYTQVSTLRASGWRDGDEESLEGRYRLKLMRDRGMASDRIGLRVTDASGRLLLPTGGERVVPAANGTRVFFDSAPDSYLFVLRLDAEGTWSLRALRRVLRVRTQVPLLEVDAPRDAQAPALSLRSTPDKAHFVEGETVRFDVTATRDCFLTLLAVDESGEVTLLAPNRWEPEARLSAGRTLSFPPVGAGFEVYVRPPHGRVTVKAIATERPLVLQDQQGRRVDAQRLTKGDESMVTLGTGFKTFDLRAATTPQPAPVKPGASLTEENIEAALQGQRWATARLTYVTHAK